MKCILKQYVPSSASGQTLIAHFICITFYMIYKFEVLKVPLTCKIFIAEIGSVLLVEKLRGTLSCKQWGPTKIFVQYVKII